MVCARLTPLHAHLHFVSRQRLKKTAKEKLNHRRRPRERASIQKISLLLSGQARPRGPASGMDPAKYKAWNDATDVAITSIKMQDKKEPAVRKNHDSAKDIAARTAPILDQSVTKEAAAALVIRQSYAPAPSAGRVQEKAWGAVPYRVECQKVSDQLRPKTVEAVLKEIRAKEIPKGKISR